MTAEARGERLWGVLLLLAGSVVSAEDYTIEFWRPEQGGMSSGGVFALTGGLELHEPLNSEPANFGFEPGYWAISPGPTLSIQASNQAVVISWSTALAQWHLEACTNPASAAVQWLPVQYERATNHSTISVTVPVSGSASLYRLRQAR